MRRLLARGDRADAGQEARAVRLRALAIDALLLGLLCLPALFAIWLTR